MERNLREFKKIDTGNPLRDLFFNYYIRIDELRSLRDFEELENTLNIVISLLPSNVTSLNVPIYDEEETANVRVERESSLAKEQQKEWDLTDLLEYSISIDMQGNFNPVD